MGTEIRRNTTFLKICDRRCKAAFGSQSGTNPGKQLAVIPRLVCWRSEFRSPESGYGQTPHLDPALAGLGRFWQLRVATSRRQIPRIFPAFVLWRDGWKKKGSPEMLHEVGDRGCCEQVAD